MCSAVKHRNHNSVEIREAAEDMRVRISDDGGIILTAASAVQKQLGQAKQNAADFQRNMENTKQLVLATRDQIKREINHKVDDQISDILNELDSESSKSSKQAESVLETYQFESVSMESFHTYSRELLDKGRPSDITRAACELHERATELLANDVTAVKYQPPHVIFTPADVTQFTALNLIGTVTKYQPGTLSSFA